MDHYEYKFVSGFGCTAICPKDVAKATADEFSLWISAAKMTGSSVASRWDLHLAGVSLGWRPNLRTPGWVKGNLQGSLAKLSLLGRRQQPLVAEQLGILVQAFKLYPSTCSIRHAE